MTVFDKEKKHIMDLAVMSGICGNPYFNTDQKAWDDAVQYVLNSTEKIIIGVNRKNSRDKGKSGKVPGLQMPLASRFWTVANSGNMISVSCSQ